MSRRRRKSKRRWRRLSNSRLIMGKTKGHQKMENQETLDAIAAEVRARAKAWPDPSLVQYDERLADRITDAARRGHLNLDALERACEEVLDAETLKKVVAAKRRIQDELKEGEVRK